MKRIIALLSFLVLLTAANCENEPLEGDFPMDQNNNLTCEEAIINSGVAATNFAGATVSTFTQLCIAYKAALTAQITACEDTDGTLQVIIDGLGDCVIDISADEFFANIDGVEFAEDQIDVAVLQSTGVPDYISIAATTSDATIALSIPVTHTPGDYEFTIFLEAQSVSGTYLNIESYPAFPGTLTILSNENNRILGTFQFTAEPFAGGGPVFQITDGAFNVGY